MTKQHLVAAFLATSLLLAATAAQAAYRVVLRNGQHFVCKNYRFEGDQLIVEYRGGTFGINKKEIVRILKTSDEVTLPQAAEPEAAKAAASETEALDEGAAEAEKAEKNPSVTPGGQDAVAAEESEEMRQLMGERDAAMAEIDAVADRQGSAEELNAAIERAKALEIELYQRSLQSSN